MASITYGYNTDGQTTSKTTAGFTGAAANAYGYDLAGRLTSWNNGTATTAYTYDDAGNRTGNGAGTLTYDARNRLTGDGTSTYTYTARGTRTGTTTSGTTAASTYDAFDRMITDASGTRTYTYDGLDRVLARGGASSAYSGTGSTLASDGSTTYTYDPAGALAAYRTTAGASLAYSDQHGDLVGGYGSAGSAMGYSKAYDPLGNVLSEVNGNVNLGYQGGWTDPTTGKLSTASRWYDAKTGGFTSRDTWNLSPNPASGNANRYSYIGGNPLGGTDPSGHGQCFGIWIMGPGSIPICAFLYGVGLNSPLGNEDATMCHRLGTADMPFNSGAYQFCQDHGYATPNVGLPGGGDQGSDPCGYMAVNSSYFKAHCSYTPPPAKPVDPTKKPCQGIIGSLGCTAPVVCAVLCPVAVPVVTAPLVFIAPLTTLAFRPPMTGTGPGSGNNTIDTIDDPIPTIKPGDGSEDPFKPKDDTGKGDEIKGDSGLQPHSARRRTAAGRHPGHRRARSRDARSRTMAARTDCAWGRPAARTGA